MKLHAILASLALLTLSGCEIDTKELIKIEKASSMAIQNAGNLELVFVKFSWHGNQAVLMWKAEPGVQLLTNEDNTLKSLSGHKLQFDTLTKVNYVNSDFTVGSIETKIPYSEDPQAYNCPEITGLLPVIRQ
jgi:hypothetical protein